MFCFNRIQSTHLVITNMNKTLYEPSTLVNLIHSLPHLNMWFIQTNSTFDPYSTEYLEVFI